MMKLHEALEKAFPQSFKQTSKYSSEAENGFIQIIDEELRVKFQAGPIKEYGLNGTQQTEVLEFLKAYLETLDKEFPSDFNKITLFHITKAIHAQEARTLNRQTRNVEGESKQ